MTSRLVPPLRRLLLLLPNSSQLLLSSPRQQLHCRHHAAAAPVMAAAQRLLTVTPLAERAPLAHSWQQGRQQQQQQQRVPPLISPFSVASNERSAVVGHFQSVTIAGQEQAAAVGAAGGIGSCSWLLARPAMAPTSVGPAPAPPHTEPPHSSEQTGGPCSSDQLAKMEQQLIQHVETMFVNKVDYSIYTKDMVFENRIRKKTTVGIFGYMRQCLLLRVLANIRFCFVTMEVLQSSSHVHDGTVRLRWRVSGVGAVKYALNCRVTKAFTVDELRRLSVGWLDGYSIFYVNSEKRVYKHIVDKMMPDWSGCEQDDKTLAGRLASRVASTVQSSTGPLQR